MSAAMQCNLRRVALPRPAARRSVGSMQPVRADGPRVTREYREDDGSITVPDQKPAGQDGALYADEVKRPVSGALPRTRLAPPARPGTPAGY
jgi:hypothetical protein